MTKMTLTHEELVILLQCIFGLNYSGKDVIKVGSLANRIQNEIIRLEQPKPTKESKNEQPAE